jgi:hypothetical protein
LEASLGMATNSGESKEKGSEEAQISG